LLTAAAALAIASTAASAQTAAQAPAAQAPQQVTKAEFQQNIDSRFGAVDTNKDGSLTKAEITAAQARALQQAQAMEAQRVEAEFKKLDTNRDNQLSVAEFKAVAPPVKAAETPDQMIAALDSNKDGKISAAEYRAQPMANFDKADANHDGILTAQEVGATRRR
jgi:Ca2+-binding EF-hand superfamily protein